MKRCCVILALLGWALTLSADPTNNSPTLKIGADEAANYIDRTMTVTGTVVQVSIHSNIVFLNMDQPYPNSPFTLIIFAHDVPKFKDIKALDGKSVEATGKIKKFHDKPEIVLESAKQLKVLPADAEK